MAEPTPTRIQLRRDTSENWASQNPVLSAAEHGLETDTGYERVGDGVTPYNSLPRMVYVNADTNRFPQAIVDAMYDQVGQAASALITPKMAADGSYEYEVVRVKLNGRPAAKVVEKIYPGGWTLGNAIPGAAKIPADTATTSGAFVVLSSDAYETNRMTNVQIKGGKIYESRWGSADAAPTGKGVEALGFRKDGTWETYSQAAGDTAASMVADGVDTSYGFGPVVVKDGAVRDIESDSTWSFFAGSVSARSIIGRTADGDVLYILVKGKSGTSGIKGNTCGQLAVAEGCVDAILLDGGGTTQGYAHGRQFHPSTDAGGTRTLRSAVAIRVPTASPIVDGPYLIPYLNSFAAVGNYPQQCIKRDGIVRLSGTSGLASAAANTWYTVGLLPERFRPATPDNVRFPIYSNQGGAAGVASIDTSGNLLMKFAQVTGSTAASWAQLDSIAFRAGY